jgi:hypothetical protein
LITHPASSSTGAAYAEQAVGFPESMAGHFQNRWQEFFRIGGRNFSEHTK